MFYFRDSGCLELKLRTREQMQNSAHSTVTGTLVLPECLAVEPHSSPQAPRVSVQVLALQSLERQSEMFFSIPQRSGTLLFNLSHNHKDKILKLVHHTFRKVKTNLKIVAFSRCWLCKFIGFTGLQWATSAQSHKNDQYKPKRLKKKKRPSDCLIWV
jgi:hypothetical protein